MPTLAYAQDAPPADPEPWAKDVSKADQDAAFALFEEGNKSFAERSYAAALRLYREAIKHWDHPAIRFNMSECHIHLDQPVEAYEHLQKSLEYGADPLEERVYRRALTNKKLLEGQLAYLVVEVKESGAAVTLDGEPLLDKPGTVKRVLRPGRHQVVAKKAGKMTLTEDLNLIPGETTTVNVKLVEIGSVPLVRRWSAWKPWAVVGTGTVLALGGVGLQLSARAKMDEFDQLVEDMCATGCVEGTISDKKKKSAELQDVISLSMMGVGVTAVAVGVALVIMNQPRRAEESPQPGRISVAPSVSPDGAGAHVSITF